MRTIWVTLDDDNETTESVSVSDSATEDEIVEILHKTFGKNAWLAYNDENRSFHSEEQ